MAKAPNTASPLPSSPWPGPNSPPCPTWISAVSCASPAFTDEPEDARPAFRTLRLLAEQLRAAGPLPLPELSMGMSHDYPIAIEEGATIVRVGSAIFGKREKFN